LGEKAMSDVIKSYLAEIDREFKTGRATEHTHRPALKNLIESLVPGVRATNEPKRVECGAPDFILRRDGLSIGYVETKDLGKSLDEAEDSGQLQRYKKSLPNLILTDYLEFRWFVDGQLRDSARMGRIGKGGKILPDKKGIEETTELLKLFLESRPEPITTPRDLSERAAKLAHIIRDTIVEAFEKERASQDLKDLRDAFAEVLIPDLNQPEKVSEFADMYAQTIVYGLFAARVNHKGPGPFQRLGASREIPKTNPFLKKLFDSITGSSLDEEPYVDFVDDLVQILANTDMEKVLENFGKRTKQEDPIVHFYETFLAAYDPKTREKRGVYYTPEPVVAYIVKSVDYILKTRFGLEGGLAHTADIVEYDREEAFLDEQGRPDRSKLLKVVPEERPKVLILDPACGTGTFLYAVMDHIRDEFMKRGDAGLWSAYVRDHLLPRLFGFELLMAPYAVAHFKLGMQLAGYDLPKEQQKQWQYDFQGDERLGIYLTNTLDEAPSEWQKLFGAYRILSEEANAASRVKRDLPIMVVLGNPPYSVSSANKGTYIEGLMERYKTAVRKEQNIQPLSDDYIKFIRFAQDRIDRTKYGIVGIITNNSYLSGLVHRGMREELIKSFSEIYIFNLHGSALFGNGKRDFEDKNVFDIRQGVAISIFVKSKKDTGSTTLFYSELLGQRDKKYDYLLKNHINTTKWLPLKPESPYFFFVPKELDSDEDYNNRAWRIVDIFPINSLGIEFGSKMHLFSDDRQSIENFVRNVILNSEISNDNLADQYSLTTTSGWRFESLRQAEIEKGYNKNLIVKCLDSPFNIQYTYHSPILRRPQIEVLENMHQHNLAMLTLRQSRAAQNECFFVTNTIYSKDAISIKDRVTGFPLYIYPRNANCNGRQTPLTGDSWTSGSNGRIPNLNPDFVSAFASRLGLKFVSDGHGDLTATFGPEDVFDYIYAVFHSPTYRQRYAQFLKIDFPRVPLTSNQGLFKKLCILGEELVALHLLESPQATQLLTRYPVAGDNIVEKGFPKFVVYEEGKPGYVYINRTQYFEGVPKEVWEFHVGGYQVCEKWLKDRRGRQLSFDDLMHYQKVIVALAETRRLMEEIDKAIPGWPIK
jgi:predicted helicase